MIAGADFFTTEVWTWRGLVTFYTVFVIDLATRRVQVLGMTPHPDEAFTRQVVRTPYHAPNANAHAERFVRSVKEECLDRIIPIGEGHFRRALTEFVTHYHRERNHQGLDNALIEAAPAIGAGRVHRRSRLGGLLNYYRRAV